MADSSGERGGDTTPDPWADLSLDEDFVKGASISEQTARSRQKQAARRGRAQRRRSGARRVAVLGRRYSLLGVAAAIVVVLVVLGSRGTGPLGSILGVRRPTEDAATTTPGNATNASSTSSSSTSSTIALAAWTFRAGECATWDQSPGIKGSRQTTTVSCDQPHLFEATHGFELDDTGYGDSGPTDEQWNAIGDGPCNSYATEFLGYGIDPEGQYYPTMLKPLPDSWRRGDRTVQCGIGIKRSAEKPPGYTEYLFAFTGRVEGADQTFLNGDGVCFGTAFGQSVTTDCAGPHLTETVGTTTVDAPPGAPYPGSDALRDQAGPACDQLAAGRYGRPLGWPVTSSSLDIAESSWNIGRRTVECVLGTASADGGWAEVPGPLRG